MKIISCITQYLGSFFRIIEESSQINIISSIIKNDAGNTIFEIGSLSHDQHFKLGALDILKTPTIYSQLTKGDLKIVKAVAYCEGDILVDSKDYQASGEEVFHLKSVISEEQWQLSKKQLLENKDVFNRLNKKYFHVEFTLG